MEILRVAINLIVFLAHLVLVLCLWQLGILAEFVRVFDQVLLRRVLEHRDHVEWLTRLLS